MTRVKETVGRLVHSIMDSAGKAKAISLSRLSILPLSGSHHDGAEFMLVNSAIEQGLVEFGEMKRSEVGRIRVTSRAKVPVLVLPGMVLEGAWQNRTAARPFVVPAGYTGPIPVFCVERGRWEGERVFRRFTGSVDSLLLSQMKARMMAQHEVWEKAHARLRRFQARSESLAYNDLLNAREIRQLADRLSEKIRLPEGATGFALFLDGKLISLELLPSHQAASQTFKERLRASVVNLIDLETLRELDRDEQARQEQEPEFSAGELRERLGQFLQRLTELEPKFEESEVGNLTKLRSSKGDYAEAVVWQELPLYFYATSGEAVELGDELDQRFARLTESYLPDELERERLQHILRLTIEELYTLAERSREVFTAEELRGIRLAIERLLISLRRATHEARTVEEMILPEKLTQARRRVVERLVEQVEQVA